MINFIHCVRRFAPALPLRGTSPREDGLHEATDAVLTHHNNQLISTVWASIRNSPRLHLKNRRDLSKVQGQLTDGSGDTLEMLRQQAISGVIWGGLEAFAMRGVSFVVQLVLARLLLPEQFGLVAMVAVFVAVAIGLADGGFSSAIIQKKAPSAADVSTAFYFNLGLGGGMVVLIFFGAPFVADFYNNPRLVLILRVLSLAVLFDAFGRIHVALLQKKLQFKQLTKAVIPGNVIGGVAGVSLAYLGFGVWALVAQTLLTRFSQMLVYWYVSDWRPNAQFSLASLKSLFPYGARLAASSFLDVIFTNIYVLIIGRLFSVADVGLFQKAVGFKNTGQMTFFTVLSRIAFPLFSAVNDDLQRLRSGFMQALKLTAFITLPSMGFVGGSSVILVTLLIGEEWYAAGTYLRILSIPGALFCLHYLNVVLLKAVGRSDLFLRLEMIKKLMIVGAICVTYRYGIMALIWGQVAVTLIGFYMNCYFTKRFVDVSFVDQLKTLCPSLIWAGLVFASAASPLYFCSGASRFWQLAVSVLFSSLLSVVFLLLFRRHYQAEQTLLVSVFRKLKGGQSS